jgi:hypothetical protein
MAASRLTVLPESLAVSYTSNVPTTVWWAHRHDDNACVPARALVGHYGYFASPADHVEAYKNEARAMIKENGEAEVDVLVAERRYGSHLYANNYGDREGSVSFPYTEAATFRYFRSKDGCDAERHQLDSYR